MILPYYLFINYIQFIIGRNVNPFLSTLNRKLELKEIFLKVTPSVLCSVIDLDESINNTQDPNFYY